MTLNLDWVLVELAFVVATALLGFIIGWKYMAIWVVGVFFSQIVSDKIGPRLGLLIDKGLSVIAQFLGIALNGNENAVKAPNVVITEAQQPLLVAGFFLFLTLFSYWIARRLGNNIAVGLLGKIIGALFGGLGTVLVLSKLSEYYQQFVAKNGKDPLAGSLNLSLPTVSVGFGGVGGPADWAGLGTLAMALFLMLLVVYTIWRVVRNVIF